MTLSDLSIKNPVFAWMLMAGLIVFGGISFKGMGVSQLPDVDFPVVSVSLAWEGAAPEVMETDVVDIVEESVMTVQGIREVSSSTRQGQATVTIEFELNRNIDAALQEVETKIAQAQRNLPRDMDPPVVTKVNPEDNPIMWLGISGDVPVRDLTEYVQDHLKDQFQTITGVGEIFLGGFVERNLRVWLDAQKLEALQLTVQDVIQAIQQEHAEMPSGRIETSQHELNVRTMGEATSVEEFGDIIISHRGNSPIYKPIYLKDVATIEDALADVRRISRMAGKSAIGLGVRKQRGANAVAVARRVRQRLAELQPQIPKGIHAVVVNDTTRFIEDSVKELTFTLLLSALLTALVCWLFLGSFSATMNVLLAIPTSVIGAFIFLGFMGFTLNTFTLLGLSLAIGIVVDDAIMVLENIVRYREHGYEQVEAARVGARQITFAAIAATLAILAIFLPVAFMQGIIGKFFFQFGVTMTVAVSLSLLEALTLAPMRCAQFLQVGERRTTVGKAVEGSFRGLANQYHRALTWIFDPQRIGCGPQSILAKFYALIMTPIVAILVASTCFGICYLVFSLLLHALLFQFINIATIPTLAVFAALALCSWLRYRFRSVSLLHLFSKTYRHMVDRPVRIIVGAAFLSMISFGVLSVLRKEFVPPQDQSMFLCRLQTPVGSSIDFTNERFKQAEAFVMSRPEVTHYYAAIGGFSGGEVNAGMLFVTLKSPRKRPTMPPDTHRLSQGELMVLFRKELNKIPGVQRAVIQDLSLSGFSAQRGFPVEASVRGPDWDTLAKTSEAIRERMAKNPLLVDVDTDYLTGTPEVRVRPDRVKAAERGVSIEAIGTTINALIGGDRVAKYTKGGRRYDVRVRLIPSQRSREEDINRLWVWNNRGELVQLKDVVTITEKPTLLTITRRGRERAIGLFANIAPGKSQNAAIEEVQRIAKEVLPPGYRIVFSGSTQTFKESFQSLGFALILGIIVAYMVLASQFNSYLHPVTVLLALPFSLSGAFLALWMARQSLNIYSYIGLILLMGIVKKNSILLVEFTNQTREEGKNVHDALLHACPVRLRPILMTSISTIAAAIPPALAIGPGAETRIPMAVCVIGGVTLSTFLTLFVVPCAYSLFSRFEHKQYHPTAGTEATELIAEPIPQP